MNVPWGTQNSKPGLNIHVPQKTHTYSLNLIVQLLREAQKYNTSYMMHRHCRQKSGTLEIWCVYYGTCMLLTTDTCINVLCMAQNTKNSCCLFCGRLTQLAQRASINVLWKTDTINVGNMVDLLYKTHFINQHSLWMYSP